MCDLGVSELHFLFNLLRWKDVATRVENFSFQNCNIFPDLSIFK